MFKLEGGLATVCVSRLGEDWKGNVGKQKGFGADHHSHLGGGLQGYVSKVRVGHVEYTLCHYQTGVR
jgi:hypothetical protein